MKYIGNGEGYTILVLTDAESRLLRSHLVNYSPTTADVVAAQAAFSRGIARGTERMAAEFKDEQKASKK